MKITIVINSIKYNNHLAIKELFEKAFCDNSITVIDMGLSKKMYELFNDIKSSSPDIIFTLDAAGFELRTELETPSLFSIHCKGAHFLFNDLGEYAKVLEDSFYLGHYIFVEDNYDLERLAEAYPNIPDWRHIPPFEEETLAEWLNAFSKEVMI